jgi:hypothetical protein
MFIMNVVLQKKILDRFDSEMKMFEADEANFVINFTSSGAYSTEGSVKVKGESRRAPLSKDLRELVSTYFQEVVVTSEIHFNRVELEVSKNGVPSIRYLWSEESFKMDTLSSARVFPEWINERVMMYIYEYEFPKGPTDTDDDGDPLYVSTWDQGVFTFKITNEVIKNEILLFKGTSSRMINLNLPDYFKEALLKHYEITNNGILKGEWMQWNKLVINSPHNNLPYGERDKYVHYSLE